MEASHNKQKENEMPRELGPPPGVFDRNTINWESAAEVAGFEFKELPDDVVELIESAHPTVQQSLSCTQDLTYLYNRRRWLRGEPDAKAFLEGKAAKLRAQAAKLFRAKFTVYTQAICLAVVSGATGALVTAFATGLLPSFAI